MPSANVPVYTPPFPLERYMQDNFLFAILTVIIFQAIVFHINVFGLYSVNIRHSQGYRCFSVDESVKSLKYTLPSMITLKY